MMIDKPWQWSFLAMTVVGVLIWMFVPRGYGKIEPSTFQVAQGIYSASLEQNLDRIKKLEQVLSEQTPDIPANQKRWLMDMIEEAKVGQWKTCTRHARLMLQEQKTFR